MMHLSTCSPGGGTFFCMGFQGCTKPAMYRMRVLKLRNEKKMKEMQKKNEIAESRKQLANIVKLKILPIDLA
ncbi:hypothetical protein TNIN_1831 [Trichonephila inaurata madagascariensis]|uniref:Uncharacterized protein n=1 Tax=Trichonephila inaurata madagascariensis TaxID=2747483 RepID=A0A8X6Y7P1_9ARAC|nr:hypothetical protein TNIN_1831 [Trichonephila inaurata madagascariensis]